MRTKVGRLEVISGPMFCGKTEELIRRIRRAYISKKKVVVIKHVLDQRYRKRKITSHNRMSIPSKTVKSAKEILEFINDTTDIIAIDEAQWFKKALIPIVQNFVKQGKEVIVAGLSSTFNAEPFEPIPSLMAIADQVDKLTAICNLCGKEAIFHKKIGIQTKNAFKITLLHVGQTEKYQARCRKCFTKP